MGLSGKKEGIASPVRMTDRVRTMLDMRLSQMDGNTWLFPAHTKSGHIEASSLRKQHAKL